MSLPRYPEYKDSAVEWLGSLPSHWEIGSLKRRYEVCLGKMLQTDSSAETDSLKPYLRAANIQWDGVDITDIKSMWFSPRDIKQLQLESGDLLISEGGDVGRSAVWGNQLNECYIQNSVNRVRARVDDSTRFLYYWMATIKAKGYVDVLCNKSTIAHFTAEKVAEVPTPFPPPAEQTAIATFLDRETGKIDTLIAEQEKLLALLAEKRQATISDAVTKGLNPDVPMWDSGIAWLGKIPEHWGHSKKLLDLVTSHRHAFVNGPFGSDLLTSELVSEGVPVVYIRDIKESGYIRVSEWCVTKEKATQLEFCNVIPGDLVVAKVGDPPGLAAIYPEGEPDGIVTQDVIRLRLDSAKSHTGYIRWLLNSKYGQTAIDQISVESTRTRVGLGEYKQLRFFIPPLEEQRAISDFLDNEMGRLDALAAEASRAVDLLKERRSALIAAAVTGQIDVRGLVTEPEAA